MVYRNDLYRVLVNTETMPQLATFDIVHNPENIDTGDFYVARVLHIQRITSVGLTVALLDSMCADYEPCAVLEDNIMTVILFRSIVRIDLDTGMIVQSVECDNTGGLFTIYPIDGGYIIWSENEILRYDLNLNQIWCFSGRDILVSPNHDRHFWVEDDLIHCLDFVGHHYVVDLDGKQIADYQENTFD